MWIDLYLAANSASIKARKKPTIKANVNLLIEYIIIKYVFVFEIRLKKELKTVIILGNITSLFIMKDKLIKSTKIDIIDTV